MKIIFFGTSSFATFPLLSLIRSEHKVLAVVTQPDKRSGRGLVRSFSPVKLVAQKYKLPVYQPATVANSDFAKTLEALAPDIFVVASFGQILPKEVLEIPKLYSINIHSSLLPKYRGAAPINWALFNGEKNTGLTIFKMTEGMDAGDIISNRKLAIEDDDTALTLNDKLSKLGADLLVETLGLIEKRKVIFTPQDTAGVTYAPKLKKKDGLINWIEQSEKIHNHVRAMMPWPTAYTRLNNKLIKVWKTRLLKGEAGHVSDPGTIVRISKEGIAVRTKTGTILICELQAEGAKKMPADAYCRGHKMEIGQKFS